MSDRAVGWSLFAAALLVRAAHLATARQAPFFDLLWIDPAMNDAWAARIASGRLLSDAPFFLDPLYAYLLAGIQLLVGRSPFSAAVLQSALGALTAPLVHAAALRWLERPAARLAGTIAAVYPVAIFYDGVLMKAGPAVVAVALGLWLLARGLEGGGRATALLAGAALAAAALMRSTLLPVVAVVAIFVALVRRRDAAWLAAGSLALLALPLAHNVAVSGEWILTTANRGAIFYLGNRADNPSGRFSEPAFLRSTPEHEQADFKAEAERRAGRALTHRGASRFWWREGLSWIASDPKAALRVTWTKLRTFWGGYETPASLDFYFYRRHAPLLGLPIPGFGLLGPLALLGATVAWRRGAWPRLLVVWIAAVTAAAVPFFVLTRFRLVMLPALYPLGALGALAAWRALRDLVRGPRRAAARPLAVLVAAWIFVDLPVRATADTWSVRLAQATGAPARVETTAKARFNLGVSHAQRAKDEDAAGARRRLELAEHELRGALAESAEAESWIELGKVLARLGRDREAIDAFVAGLELEPRDVRAWHAVGLLHHRGGDLSAAEQAFRRALELGPNHLASALELGHVLLEAGRADEAAEAYGWVLRMRPDHEEARAGLARAARRDAREPD